MPARPPIDTTNQSVAEHLNRLLRGKPYSEYFINYASGHLADLRDVMLSQPEGQARRRAVVAWLDSALGDDQLMADRLQSYGLVMDSRPLDDDFFDKVPGTPKETGDPLVDAFLSKVTGIDCTCQTKGSYIDIFMDKTRIFPNNNNDRRTCPYHRHKNAYRFTRQVEAEQRQRGAIMTTFDSEEDWTRCRKKWNKRHERGQEKVTFRPFYQDDGSVTVIHSADDEPGNELPADNIVIMDMLLNVLDHEHETKRSRSSSGFGGSYSGTRGHGNDDEKYAIKCNVSPARLAKKFNAELNSFGAATIKIDRRDAFVNLLDLKRRCLAPVCKCGHQDYKHSEKDCFFEGDHPKKGQILYHKGCTIDGCDCKEYVYDKPGYDINLEERWPQGMDNEVARTIYNDEKVQEVLDRNREMSPLVHNSPGSMCNKGDTVTLPTDKPPPKVEIEQEVIPF